MDSATSTSTPPGWQRTTKLSKSGQPVMGTTIDIAFTDHTWGPAKVVGKLYGKRGNSHLVGVFVEWPEGDRQRVDTVSDDFVHDINDTWRAHHA